MSTITPLRAFVIKICLLLVITLTSTSAFGQETTTYYLIRHAEKDLSDKSNRNPHLTEEGHNRAHSWSTIFKEVNFDMIYSTAYHRTLETAKPTAAFHDLEIREYNPRYLYNDAFKQATQGKTVLIVGHSNTTPSFVNKILGKETYTSIDESIHGNLYIVSCVDDTISCQVLSIN